MTIYLYVKTHRVTGLKYLGTTVSKNPHNYKGSGKYWRNHIKKHGYDVDTEILFETKSKEELAEKGLYYSKLWNIVDSTEWANLKPESGAGGGYVAGSKSARIVSTKLTGHPNWSKPWTTEAKQKLSKTNKEALAKLTPEELTTRAKNSFCHPDSYTPERIKNMRTGMIGKKKTKTVKFLESKKLTKDNRVKKMLECAEKHRGRTWKLIDGKRVWMDKENQNY